jgi:DNA repair protein RecO (recombination protein O)
MNNSAMSSACVLHSRRYGDTSLLVELFGPDLGRVACIAKGALSAKRNSVRLQPFQPLLVVLRGRGEVQTLAQAEASGSAPALAGRALFCGLYLNELLLKTTARGDPLPGLYKEYISTLRKLADLADVEPVLRRFEVALLGELGQGLELVVDDQGRPIEADARYVYRIDGGPMKAAVDASNSYPGTVYQALSTGVFETAEIQREARLFMREVLDHHLDGKPIRSRDLFR